MLTSGVRRGSLAALAVMLLALVGLVGGTAMVQAQAQTLDEGTTTLTPGQGASPQEELLAEALGALVEAGYNPADFDFERSAFDPQGRAVFLPVRITEELDRQAQEFLQDERQVLLIGLLYARQPVEFRGKLYIGLHPILIARPELPDPAGGEALVIPWQPGDKPVHLFSPTPVDPGGGGSEKRDAGPDPTLCAFLIGLGAGLAFGGAGPAAATVLLTAWAIGCGPV